MKSKLFGQEIVPSSDLINDIRNLSGKSPDAKNEFIKWFNNLEVKPQRLEKQKIDNPDAILNIANKFDIPSNKLIDLFKSIQFILRKVLVSNDDLHLIVDDLIAQNVFLENERDELYGLFDEIKEKGFEFAKQRRRSAYEKGQLPAITEIDYDVDLRLIPEVVFDPLETHIEDYEPKLAELVPTALISLLIDNGYEKSYTAFQVNFSELEDLIVKLQACQKELRLIESISSKIAIPDKE